MTDLDSNLGFIEMRFLDNKQQQLLFKTEK